MSLAEAGNTADPPSESYGDFKVVQPEPRAQPARAASRPPSSGGIASEIADLDKRLKEEFALGHDNKVLRLYTGLRERDVYPDLAGFEAALTACVRLKIGAKADHVLADLAKSSTLGLSGGLTLRLCKLALIACAESSRPEEAVSVLDTMVEAGLAPDLEAVTLAMKSCCYARAGTPVEGFARKVMLLARSAKVEVDGKYYGLLLQVLTRVRKYREAVACFELLALDDNFTPNEDHYLAAMKAASVTKDMELVKTLVGEVLVNEASFTTRYGQVMEMAARASATADNWRLASRLLDRAPAPRSPDAWHAVVAAAGRDTTSSAALELALSTFERMKAEGHAGERKTYNALLHACSAAGDVEGARRILEEMTANKIRLNVVTYNIALNSRARAGDARGAVNLLAEMETAGITPSVISFATAINAAAGYNSSALAVTLMKAMEPAGLVPNEYVYTAALAACENDPDDSAASASAQEIVNTMAKAGAQETLPQDLVVRIGDQARRLLTRDLGSRDLSATLEDQRALGVSLTGRQSAV